jgi:hypothetical protein
MVRTCTSCRTTEVDDRMIRCARCNGQLGSGEDYQTAEQKIDLQQFLRVEAALTRGELDRRVAADLERHIEGFNRRTWIAGFITFFALIGVVAQYVGYQRSVSAFLQKAKSDTEAHVAASLREVQTEANSVLRSALTDVQVGVNKRIDSEFKTERIREIVSTAAKEQATDMLQVQVRPRVESFNSSLTDLQKRYSSDYQAIGAQVSQLAASNREASSLNGVLSSQVDRLKRRNDVTKLADDAISNMDKGSYMQLLSLITTGPDDEIRSLAETEMLRVKLSFIGGD